MSANREPPRMPIPETGGRAYPLLESKILEREGSDAPVIAFVTNAGVQYYSVEMEALRDLGTQFLRAAMILSASRSEPGEPPAIM